MSTTLSIILVFLLTLGGSSVQISGAVCPVHYARSASVLNQDKTPVTPERSPEKNINAIPASTTDNTILFQGREYDDNVIFNYCQARYYEPVMSRFLQTDPLGYQDSMNLYQGFNMNPVNFVDPMGEEISGNILKYWGSYEEALNYVKYIYGLYLSGGDSADTAYKKLVSSGLVTSGDNMFALKLALSRSLDVFDVTPAQFGKDVLGGLINAVTSTAGMALKGLPGVWYDPCVQEQVDSAKNWVQGKINNAIGSNEGSLGYWIGETYGPAVAGGYLAGRIAAVAQTQSADDMLGLGNPGKDLISPNFSDKYVKLYREMSDTEYQNVIKTGKFEAVPSSMEGKFFAERASDAAKWGDYFYGSAGNYRVIEIEFPLSVASNFMRWERLDGIGPARYAELELLVDYIIRLVK